ncbi:MAG: pyridoxal-dependent decarboxylase [Pelagimonas sp.]|jgi:aromatic-L-amino-acid decarboxylase|nr:pyridoxal-dependent decarboxylase [Pelagimonas sp.]
MDWDDFAHWGTHISNWAADYHKTLAQRPVRAQTAPGEIAAQLPPTPPEQGEAMAHILTDFEQIVMPGMTHWQHPRFFAYFPANAAPPSMLAEMLVTTIAAQCMLWQTSPAATEVETVMVDWLRQAMGLPDGYTGVIQDSASSATLSAVLTMRERATGFTGNRDGVSGKGHLRIYCSDQVHSSIDRACWVAGIGQDNLVKIGTTGPTHGIDPAALEAAILADKAAGYTPAGIVAITGGTGIGACDDLLAVSRIAQRYGLYTHLDAAWAGSAMICPEFRTQFWRGAETYDSLVFNPHKWLGAQFDCSVQFLADPQPQLDTLKIEPEYLKTTGAQVTNFSEWTIPLGRRFRALKIWFLLRAYGLEGLRDRLRNHVTWAAEVATAIEQIEGFEICTGPILSLFSFRCPGDDAMQQRLVDALNDDGRIYLTQGMFDGRKIIRFQVGQFDTTRDDVMLAAEVIRDVWENLT